MVAVCASRLVRLQVAGGVMACDVIVYIKPQNKDKNGLRRLHEITLRSVLKKKKKVGLRTSRVQWLHRLCLKAEPVSMDPAFV